MQSSRATGACWGKRPHSVGMNLPHVFAPAISAFTGTADGCERALAVPVSCLSHPSNQGCDHCLCRCSVQITASCGVPLAVRLPHVSHLPSAYLLVIAFWPCDLVSGADFRAGRDSRSSSRAQVYRGTSAQCGQAFGMLQPSALEVDGTLHTLILSHIIRMCGPWL